MPAKINTAHFKRFHSRIQQSLQGMWNEMFIRLQKTSLNAINMYSLNADSRWKSIIAFAFITNNKNKCNNTISYTVNSVV